MKNHTRAVSVAKKSTLLAVLSRRGVAVFGALVLMARLTAWGVSDYLPIQTFYVPIPEDHLLLSLQTIVNGTWSSYAPADPVQTYLSIAVFTDDTRIYFDHWENGFDPNIGNPTNRYHVTANPGGTQVWGDGDLSNGFPPGFIDDILNAGSVIVLNNGVPSATREAIDFDGGDKIAASKPVAVTRAVWASGSATLLAGANEVYDTAFWGKAFQSPIGEDIPDGTDAQMFEYTAFSIMAGVGGATVQVDANADGAYEASVTLAEGEGYLVNGGVSVGGRIVSDRPVQVDVITADVYDGFESRFVRLLPTAYWSSSATTPVSTPANMTVGETTYTSGTTVWLYNPGAAELSVNYVSRSGANLTTNVLSVPGGASGGYLKQVLPDGSGARFMNTNGLPFYALTTVDSTGTDLATGPSDTSGDNRTWDWGFTLVPEASLTPQVLVGLGIGRDPTSAVNPAENGSPIWATLVGNGNSNVTVYVDYDADPTTGPLTDPNGNQYDVAYTARELDQLKIYNPDGDQTGMMVYVLEPNVKIAAAWGADPLTTTPGSPGLDMGTGIPPFPLFVAQKKSALLIDADLDGYITPGDVLRYGIVIENTGRQPVTGLDVLDVLPPGVIYQNGTTLFVNSSSSTNVVQDNTVPPSQTIFPLDEGGIELPEPFLPVRSSWEVLYTVQIDGFSELPPGSVSLQNTATVGGSGLTTTNTVVTPIRARAGNTVWWDANGDGLQSVGEPGVNGVTVSLLTADGEPALDDNGHPMTAVTANDDEGNPGYYLFVGVLPGDYILAFAPPPGYVLTAQDSDGLGLAGVDNSDADRLTGRTGLFTLVGGEVKTSVDAGLVETPASLSGAVRVDADGDGFIEAEDNVGIAGVTIRLLDASSAVVATTTTSGAGDYSFSNVTPGSYTVVQMLPAGYTNTADVAAPNDLRIPRTLTSGQNSPGNDFYDTITSAGRQNKILYLSDPSQALDRVDPVASSDTSTANTATLIPYREGALAVDAVSSVSKALPLTALALNASSSVAGNAASITLSHTTGTGNDRLLLVGVSMRTGNQSVSSVTYNGVSLTLVGANSNGVSARMEIWQLVNPPSGTFNVVVNLSASGRAVVGASTFFGVDQTEPLGAFASATATSTTPSVTVSSSVGELVFDTVAHATGQSAMTPGANQTEQWDVDSGGTNAQDVRGAGSTTAGAASVTTSWTAGGSDAWALGAVSIKPARVSIAHTTGTGADRLMLVGVSYEDDDRDGTAGDLAISSVTYAGQALTLVGTVNGTADETARIYRLLNPPSGTGTVVVEVSNPEAGDGMVVGVATFTGVDQTAPLGAFASASGDSSPASVTVASGAGEIVFDTFMLDDGDAIAGSGSGQTPRWNLTQTDNVSGSGSTKAGAAPSTGMSWTFDTGTETWALGAVSVKPAIYYGAPQTTFTQAPAFALPFGLAAGTALTITNFVTVTSGTMPANPAITARLSAGGTTLLTLSNPTYNSGNSSLVWSGSLGSAVAIAVGEAISLSVSNAQSGVEFLIRYDSATSPSKIILPTASVIAVPSLAVYDAAYPGGSPAAMSTVTAMRFVRMTVTDPFGAHDITGVALAIDGPGTGSDLNVPLGQAQVVSSDALSKTYEYAWQTTSTLGTYTLTATAQEGSEGIVATATTDQTLIPPVSAIGDFVWVDSNGNGQQDAGEPGLSNVVVRLYDANSVVVASTTSTVSGAYLFTGLAVGSYGVGFTPPAGYLFTTSGVGNANSDSDALTGTNRTAWVALIGSQTNQAVDAGFYLPASLSGFVRVDLNGNGVAETGDTNGIAGATVQLLDAASNVVAATATAADGSYSFTGLFPGAYTVRETDLGGWYSTTDIAAPNDNRIPVTLTSGLTSTGNTFHDAQRAVIGDFVWLDSNGNGQQDGGEPGRSNVVVRLYDTNGDVVGVATSSVAGAYAFTGVAAGTYTVGFAAPDGYLFTTSNVSSDALDSDPLAGTNRTAAVTLASGQTDTTVDAGLIPGASLSGVVRMDLNGNGVVEAGDTNGLAGVTLQVLNSASNVVATTTTGSDGSYRFADLYPGVYTVREIDLGGWYSTADSTAPNDNLIPVTLAMGQVSVGNHFYDTLSAAIGDRVWIDANGNGQQDGGETGLANVVVRLYDTNSAVLATVTSTEAGAYAFTNLTIGSYTVAFTPPAGFLFTKSNVGNDASDSDPLAGTNRTAAVTLVSGQADTSVDAGFYLLASLSGAVRVDADGDGVIDAEDTVGIAGVTVRLLDASSNVVATTTTSATGAYAFANVTPGSYTVVQSPPTGYTNTVDGVAPNDLRIPLALTSGQHSTSNDFYDTRPSGTVSVQNKVLYLSDPSQSLDRIDPVASGDTSTTNTAVLRAQAAGVITHAATTSSSGTGNTLTFSHTPGTDENRLLLVSVVTASTTGTTTDAPTVSDVTFGGSAMTLVGTIPDPGNRVRVYLYQMVNPPSAAANVVVTSASSTAIRYASATTYTGVDQASPLGLFSSAAVGDASGAGGVTSVTLSGIASSTGELVYGVVGVDADGTAVAITAGGSQTVRWEVENGNTASAGASTAPGAPAVSLSYSWTGAQQAGLGAVSIKPAAGSGTHVADFMQSPAFELPFTLASGATVHITNYVTVTSGSMPANPAIIVRLSAGGSTFLTLSNPTFNSGSGLLVWSGTLGSTVNVAAGQAISMSVSNAQSGVEFLIRYDSATYPSKIILPTASIIAVPSLGVYDAAYPGGAPVASSPITAQRYVRVTVTDPFGAYDITGAGLVIDGPGSSGDVSASLTGAQVVSSNAWSKTYEYAWQTAALSGGYTITVTAHEGSEGVTASATTTATLYAATLGDFVWNDANGNGQQDVNEPGLSNVVVRLYDANGAVVGVTTSSVEGAYAFTDLLAGAYAVGFEAPAGYLFTTSNMGNAATDSDPLAGTNRTASVTLSSGQTYGTVDAGFYAAASVSGFVRVDLNGNGAAEAGDTNGITGVTVQLLDAATNVVATATTAANGAYGFTGLRPGIYTVRETDLGGWYSTADVSAPNDNLIPVTLAIGQSSTGNNFHDTQRATVGDLVWLDANGNGQQDGGETGLSNVVVRLYDANGAILATATSSVAGAYAFTGLAAGSYTVGFAVPAGYLFTTSNVGIDATDSDPLAGTNRTAAVTLSSGQTDSSVDAGFYRAASVSGYVRVDLNGNGIAEAGDTNGVAGVTVQFLDAASNVVATAATAADGSYSFANLRPGSYTVRETDLAGWYSTADASAPNDNLIPVTLAVGQNSAGHDFHDTQRGAVGDRVWLDANGNGQQDGGETGLSNVVVRLYDVNSVVVGTATSNVSGAYAFTNLLAGAYTVGFTAPAGYLFTTSNVGADATDSDPLAGTNRTAAVTLASGQTDSSVDAGFYLAASVSGFVRVDLNGNGAVEAGDTNGITGVTVQLLDAASNVVATAATAADGSYSFANLRPGSYTVRETDLAGWYSTADASAPNDNLIPVTLAIGQKSAGHDFHDTRRVTVGDRVWLDANGNGQQDGGETGLSNVVVRLYDTNGAAVGVTTSSVTGAYAFTNLLAGAYTVGFSAPAGYLFTTSNVGADATDSDPLAGTNRTAAVTLASGQTDSSVDAGFYPAASISGFVRVDLNGNGAVEAGDTNGIAGVTVELLDAASNVLAIATTAANGAYSFANLRPGSYTVRETDLGGWYSTADASAPNDNLIPVTLAIGQNSAGNNFYDTQRATVGDFVWFDANGNGQQDGGETGLSNVVVRLYDANGESLATTTSSVSGAYAFTGLAAGAYTVGFAAPAGYLFTTSNVGIEATDSDPLAGTNRTATVTLASGQTDSSVDAGFYAAASIAGFVRVDLNGNGVAEAGDTNGIAGATVQLLDASANVVATATTAANGAYSFANLRPGAYTVRETDLAGWYSTADVSAPNDNLIPVTLTIGQNSTGNLFHDTQRALIGDFVWLDANGNGQQDGGETGLSNVVVRLYDVNGAVVGTATSSVSGAYVFTNLAAGAYTVGFAAPAGYLFTTSNVGGEATDSDPLAGTNRTAAVTLASGQTDSSVDAGFYAAASVSGFVRVDLNGNGIAEAGDTNGVAGVTVQLLDAASNVIATAATAANGSYSFANLRPGSYTVRETDLTGWYSTADASAPNDNLIPVTLTIGQNSTGNIFHDTRRALIGNFVWNDLDGNGQQDGGETGLSNVVVRLYDANSVVVGTATSSVSGAYAFTNLLAGAYTVGFAAPAGFLFTTSNVGNDATDSDPLAGTNRTAAVTLTSGQTDNSVDAGFFLAASVSGYVRVDLNGNGIAEAGDTNGVAGVTVQLLDAASNVIATAATAANGSYSFANLRPGSYTVRETDLGGWYSTADVSAPNDNLIPVTLAVGQVSTGNTFCDAQPASIGDRVWNDLDGDRTQDAFEPGIANVRVYVDSNGSETYDDGEPTAMTDSNGSYQISSLLAGTYVVRVDTVTLPAGMPPTCDLNGALDHSATVTVNSNQARTDVDFGYRTTAVYTIRGQVRDDYDQSGNLNKPDKPVGGVKVTLFSDPNGDGDPSDGSKITNVRTDAEGRYAFTNVPSGAYVVVETDPTHSFSTADKDGDNDNRIPVVIVNADSVENDFLDAVDPAGYFYDVADGRIVPGGRIDVSGDGALVLMDGSSGQYMFISTNSAASTFTITVTPPPDYVIDPTRPALPGSFDPTGGPDPTVLGSTESAVAPGYLVNFSAASNTYYYTFTLEPGDPPVINNNFPLKKIVLEVTGTVFYDANRLTDNTVNGTGTDAGGLFANLVDEATLMVIARVAVATDGTYRFSETDGVLANTTYVVILTRILQPVGSVVTGATLPPEWVSTGEHVGAEPGSDGMADSWQKASTTADGVREVNFGIVSVPDITPVITATPNVMTGVTDYEIYVKCIELKGINTTGLITLRIPKDSRWVMRPAWNPSMTQLPVSGLPVQNPRWSFSEDASTYFFTTTDTIMGSSQATFGFGARWNSGQTRGSYTISVAIVPGSGGEDRINNNNDSETVDYSY